LVALLVRWRARAGEGDRVERALRELVPLARSEAGCSLFEAARSQDDPDLFLLLEHYRDEAAVEAHRETPHFKRLVEGTVVPLLEERVRQALSPIEP
jgi:(4S)-4-hydroxy-5-phosphonooxypentane-2,3-dione isomerase